MSNNVLCLFNIKC